MKELEQVYETIGALLPRYLSDKNCKGLTKECAFLGLSESTKAGEALDVATLKLKELNVEGEEF